jgi:hypothetical protein
VWRGTPQQVREARAMRPENATSDTAYVIAKEEKLVAVQGKAVAVDGDALVFRYDDSDRRIALSKLVGLTMATADTAAPSPRGLRQTFTTLAGDALTGTWMAADADAFTLAPSAGGDAVVLARDAVTAVAFKGGRLVHLADLTPSRVEQTPYFDRLMPYRVDAALGGGPITLADGPHARGVAVHSRCVLDYPLGGEFEQFRATLGFEQPAGRIGRAIVRVLGDGRVLYENTDARGDGPVVPLDLPVGGVRTLTLEVDFGTDQDSGDRVAWADARLLRKPRPQGIGSAGGQP